MSTALRASVLAAAPGDLAEQAAGAAADALLESWPKDQPGSPLAVMLRSCAASLLEAAGDDAVGQRAVATACCWRLARAWTPPACPARLPPGGSS